MFKQYKNDNSPLKIKSYHFAIRIVKMTRLIKCNTREENLLKQIFRSGTAIGALISEAEFAQSPADFINKLSVALKECNETIYWLDILKDVELLTDSEYESMLMDAKELLAMLISSIKTVKNKISNI